MVAPKEIVEQTVRGLGYDLVEIQRTGAGLLRVTIDWPWPAAVERFIAVEDCEKVTRQLLFALEVDGIEFTRLEVSSPGIDRLLRGPGDFGRFLGQVIDITLKAPLGAATGLAASANRKKFRGTLERASGEIDKKAEVMRWQIVWRDELVVKPGGKVSKKRLTAPAQALAFALDELKEARLAPIVSFKGRAPREAVAGKSE